MSRYYQFEWIVRKARAYGIKDLFVSYDHDFERVADLISRMSLEEKVRQLDIYSGNEISDSVEGLNADALNYEKMEKVSAGIGIGCIQNRNSKAETANKIQEYIIQNTRWGIPGTLQ